jgi:hypothetical protein
MGKFDKTRMVLRKAKQAGAFVAKKGAAAAKTVDKAMADDDDSEAGKLNRVRSIVKEYRETRTSRPS